MRDFQISGPSARSGRSNFASQPDCVLRGECTVLMIGGNIEPDSLRHVGQENRDRPTKRSIQGRPATARATPPN